MSKQSLNSSLPLPLNGRTFFKKNLEEATNGIPLYSLISHSAVAVFYKRYSI